jgi:hypothetical protein
LRNQPGILEDYGKVPKHIKVCCHYIVNMDLSRRDVLKGIGAMGAAGATQRSLTQDSADSDFNSLQEKVDERRNYREENRGATIYLGSADSLDLSVDDGYVSDIKFEDVEKMLDEGKTPEEIANSDKRNLKREKIPDAQAVREQQEEVKLVYISEEGNNRPLESYSESLENAFSQLEPSVDLDVSVESVKPDSEDLQSLNNVSSDDIYEGQEADLDLKIKYSETGQEPIFLVENDILPDAGGLADYITDVAFVELVDNEAYNQHVINHEAGHSILGLPHHFHEDGAMSYNPQADQDEAFHPRSRMMAKALLTGDTTYSVEDESANVLVDGEREEKNYKLIEIEYESRNLEKEAVTQDFFSHLTTYAEQVLGHDMGSWTPENHELVEDGDQVYDVATYRHTDGSEMTLKVDNYIEEMSLQKSS